MKKRNPSGKGRRKDWKGGAFNQRMQLYGSISRSPSEGYKDWGKGGDEGREEETRQGSKTISLSEYSSEKVTRTRGGT